MTNRLSRSELRIWVTLISGMKSFLGALDRQLRDDFGISHDDYRILAWLSRAGENGAGMSELARTMGFSPSRLTHAIQRFESEGWVIRMTTRRDRRVVEVGLTERGAQWVDEVSAGHLATVKTLLFDTIGIDGARHMADLMREVGQVARGS
ncbi:MAG: MarR family transcriptional regulator [Acidimicrobiia bacterium]|jgi:DNA-binding MarR family transcriptional regulator